MVRTPIDKCLRWQTSWYDTRYARRYSRRTQKHPPKRPMKPNKHENSSIIESDDDNSESIKHDSASSDGDLYLKRVQTEREKKLLRVNLDQEKVAIWTWRRFSWTCVVIEISPAQRNPESLCARASTRWESTPNSLASTSKGPR